MSEITLTCHTCEITQTFDSVDDSVKAGWATLTALLTEEPGLSTCPECYDSEHFAKAVGEMFKRRFSQQPEPEPAIMTCEVECRRRQCKYRNVGPPTAGEWKENQSGS